MRSFAIPKSHYSIRNTQHPILNTDYQTPTMKIIFMGTPDFAVPGLNALIDQKKNVVAVITAPDKQAGRGLKVQTSPI